MNYSLDRRISDPDPERALTLAFDADENESAFHCVQNMSTSFQTCSEIGISFNFNNETKSRRWRDIWVTWSGPIVAQLKFHHGLSYTIKAIYL